MGKRAKKKKYERHRPPNIWKKEGGEGPVRCMNNPGGVSRESKKTPDKDV